MLKFLNHYFNSDEVQAIVEFANLEKKTGIVTQEELKKAMSVQIFTSLWNKRVLAEKNHVWILNSRFRPMLSRIPTYNPKI